MNDNFRDQLHDLGLNPGDVILMHSSMKALGTKKAPIEFIEDIISVIGPEGTLLLPALTYENVSSDQPLFKAGETEPCIGLLPRTFFHMPGVVRSLHPTHSVCAFGMLALKLTREHILDETPVGPHSPFMKILDYDGKLLFIGDVLKSCTFMHGIEEAAGAPYTLEKKRTGYILVDTNGNVVEKNMFAHDFRGIKQEYPRIRDILDYPDLRTGKVGNADCFLINASALFEKAKEKFRENLYYFVTTL